MISQLFDIENFSNIHNFFAFFQKNHSKGPLWTKSNNQIFILPKKNKSNTFHNLTIFCLLFVQIYLHKNDRKKKQFETFRIANRIRTMLKLNWSKQLYKNSQERHKKLLCMLKQRLLINCFLTIFLNELWGRLGKSASQEKLVRSSNH